jgi:predicted nucleic acid-binding protein
VKTERVVVNASPLIVLFKGGLADLLPALFAEIIVPQSVWDEVIAGGETDAAARALPGTAWARKAAAANRNATVEAWNLGAGESEVLNIALTITNCRAVIDDRAARACARTLGVPVFGTGGMIVLAKRRGLIPSVAEALQKLRDSGLWLSADVERLLREHGGER